MRQNGKFLNNHSPCSLTVYNLFLPACNITLFLPPLWNLALNLLFAICCVDCNKGIVTKGEIGGISDTCCPNFPYFHLSPFQLFEGFLGEKG